MKMKKIGFTICYHTFDCSSSNVTRNYWRILPSLRSWPHSWKPPNDTQEPKWFHHLWKPLSL